MLFRIGIILLPFISQTPSVSLKRFNSLAWVSTAVPFAPAVLPFRNCYVSLRPFRRDIFLYFERGKYIMKKRILKFFSLVLSVCIMFTAVNVLTVSANDGNFTVTVAVEGLTLGQGLYVEPRNYDLDRINELAAQENLGPYTADTVTPAVIAVAMFKDLGMEWSNSGDIDNFYLQQIKNIDKGTLNIPSIISENGGPTNEENDGNDDEWLGEFDYDSMSGWMITVDNAMIPVGAGAYTSSVAESYGKSFGNGSVIRWHFTLHGWGADLGYDTGWGGTPYFVAADRSALYRKYAELSANGFFDTHAKLKAETLETIEQLTASQSSIDAAYNALTAAEKEAKADYAVILNESLANLAATVTEPNFGTAAGEWSVLALARGGYYEKNNKYFSDYYDRITETVKGQADENGALHKTKSTENSRLIMALSSIGKDAKNVGGVNLTAPYNDFSWITKQGLNGPVFALIALDTNNYKTTDTTIRDKCIEYILSKELSSGGWAFFGTAADPDMTSMALQSLAPYKEREDVAAACNRAFGALSSVQLDNGGFGSWGSVNAESIAQVLVACTAHGIDPTSDSRFIKNGNTIVDALLSFYDADEKMFRHTASGSANAMATDQAVYALVAYKRFVAGENSLYDMTDAFDKETVPSVILGIPAKIGATVNTSFKANISVDGFNNDGGYKLIDCIVNVPAELSVTGVTASSRLSGGQLMYNLEQSTGKLRIVYFDPQNNSDINVSGSVYPAELFTISFKLNKTLDPTVTASLGISVGGMSYKRSSDSSDELAMTVLKTDTAFGNIEVVNGVAYSAAVLYQGDGIDLIPADKKAVAVTVTELDKNAALKYDDGSNTVDFLYSAEISNKTGLKSYVAIVPASIAAENFGKAEYFTLDEENSAQEITFGDTNFDGLINAQDALSSVNFWLRRSGLPTDTQILALNVNSDSRINTFDALGTVEMFVNGTEPIVVARAAVLASERR